jgi:hypothetical protein
MPATQTLYDALISSEFETLVGKIQASKRIFVWYHIFKVAADFEEFFSIYLIHPSLQLNVVEESKKKIRAFFANKKVFFKSNQRFQSLTFLK